MDSITPLLKAHCSKLVAKDSPLSDYQRGYLQRMLPVLDYYLDIYQHCLSCLASRLDKPVAEATIVDYGGGHGILGIMAKWLGWRQVVYIDLNPEAAKTVSALADAVGLGPDVILTGDSKTLKLWMQVQGETPDAVAGMDVIEHIYCLDAFFGDLASMGEKAPLLLFTTASNPRNPFVCRRLRKAMKDDETGTSEIPNFFTLRYEYILSAFPGMDEKIAQRWARDTRGLIYDDILRAVQQNLPNLLADSYNTCDPRTGSWTERILPISDYKDLLQQYGYTLRVENGWYNTHQWFGKRSLARLLNRINTIRLAPFIILNCDQ